MQPFFISPRGGLASVFRVEEFTLLRPAQVEDKPALVELCIASGLFQAGELSEVSGILQSYFDGALGEDHYWIIDDDGGAAGIAYYAPAQLTEGTWNLHLIAVHPKIQGQGRGRAIMDYVESNLRKRGERLLIVETSGVGSFEKTRQFYRKCGYSEEARIRDYYTDGADKITFTKKL